MKVLHLRATIVRICIAIIVMCAGPASAALQGIPEKAKGLITECRLALDSRRYDLLEQTGKKLRRFGEVEHNKEIETLGVCAILNARISTHNSFDYKSDIALVTQRHEQYKSDGNPDLSAATAHILGKYNHFILNSYSTSLQYYLEALENHRKSSDRIGEIADLSAIAVINLHLGEESGWEYAINAYNEAKRISHNPSRYITAANLGNFLFNEEKYNDALRYLQEAESIAGDMHYEMESAYLNTFKASIYDRTGRKELAETYYRQALKAAQNPRTTRYDILYSQIQYASFLMSEKRFSEAKDILITVERMMEHLDLRTFRTQVYPLIADCMEALGEYREALAYQKKTMKETQELMSEEKEREFAVLDLRYKVSEEKRKNAAQALDLLKRKRYVEYAVGIIILLMIASLAFLLYHRKRMAAFRAIVRSHLENEESARRMKEHYEKLLNGRDSEKGNGLTDDKATDLFERLEKLMTDDHVYRQCDLSLDKTAKMLNTNRTYLSQVVNERAESFTAYVNTFRLKEAIRMLSDPESTDSLKAIGLSAGFASPSNFYSLFRKKIGMAPSVFRENARNITSEKTKPSDD